MSVDGQAERTITCINCPMGCRLTVTMAGEGVAAVAGNACKRGETYARQECVAPRRMVTAVVPVRGSGMPLSVKTREPVPKDKIFDVMRALEALRLSAPIALGEVVLPDAAGTGVDIVATKHVPCG